MIRSGDIEFLDEPFKRVIHLLNDVVDAAYQCVDSTKSKGGDGWNTNIAASVARRTTGGRRRRLPRPANLAD